MLAHILAATDLSHRSEAAIARAVQFAARYGNEVKLTLLHVVEGDQPEAITAREIEMAQDLLSEQARGLEHETACEVSACVVAGDPIEQISNVATDHAADLIVIGRHRSRPLRDIFIGTTAERVIWRGTHPVLMVKQAPAGQYKRIGIAIDCSEASATALRVSASLGLLEEARISIVHAREPFAKTTLSAHANQGTVREHIKAELEIARTELTQFLRDNGRTDLVSRLYLDDGEPIEVLRNFIRLEKPDLLVMGTHGRSGLPRLLLGSVTEEALRTLDLDILVVPPAD